MAVINSPQIGIARGKLGDAVYYRSKGNTNARGYNPNTTNRRTVRQQTQRSLFSSAVKFFSRGVQNLFVFAFEDKRTQESDYNAFMRYNAKRGMYFGPDQNEDPNYPALGEFILTQGSLPRVEQDYVNQHVTAIFHADVANERYSTVANLSQVLINSAQNFQNGDIITFLQIVTDCRQGSPSEPVIVGSFAPQWVLRQLVVDVTDNRSLDALGFDAYGQNTNSLKIEATDLIFENQYISCFAVIHSRLVGGSLRVSDCILQLSGAAGLALTFGRSATWKAIVDAAWGTEELSILQGGIASRSERRVIPSIFNTFPLPSEVGVVGIGSTIVSGSWTAEDFEAHLVIADGDGQILQRLAQNSHILYQLGADTVLEGELNEIDGNTVIGWDTAFSQEMEIARIYWD